MKSLILMLATGLLATGCATSYQTGQLLGAITGAAVGKTLGGTGGAVIGTVVGTSAGAAVGAAVDNKTQSQTVVIDSTQVYQTQPPRVIYVQPYYPAPSAGWIWVYTPRYGYGWYHPQHRHFYHRGHRR